MIFNLERKVLRSVFTYHKRYLDYDTPENIVKIVDNLCELNLPNTPIMERIARLLEDKYNIWERESLGEWVVNYARIDFKDNNIKIYIGQLIDGDDPITAEEQIKDAVDALTKHSIVYHLDDDFDYYEVLYFDSSIQKEGEMFIKMLEIMVGEDYPFDIYKL